MNPLFFYPLRIAEYLAELKANVPEIIGTKVLADPSEVGKFAHEVHTQDIHVFGLIPDVDSQSKSVDQLRFVNTLGFRVVERSDYSAHSNNEEWMLTFQRTAEVVEKIMLQIIEDKNNENYCDDLRWLNVESFTIRPVWHESHWNGWDLEFSMDMQ